MSSKKTIARGAIQGTAALKLSPTETAAPGKGLLGKEKAKRSKRKAKKAQPAKSRALLQLTGRDGARAILAIAAVALVVVITLGSYAKLVMVNDQVVDLRSQLRTLETEETKLMAQYELSYDLQEIETQMLSSGKMMKLQDWQTYTLELSEPDAVEYYQSSDIGAQIQSFAKGLVSAVKEYF